MRISTSALVVVGLAACWTSSVLAASTVALSHDPSEDPAAAALLQSLNITREEIRQRVEDHFCPEGGEKVNRPVSCSCPDTTVHPWPEKPLAELDKSCSGEPAQECVCTSGASFIPPKSALELLGLIGSLLKEEREPSKELLTQSTQQQQEQDDKKQE